MVTVRLALALTITCAVYPAFADDCLTGYLQRNVIKAIVECQSINDLNHLKGTELFRNDVTNAIFALRAYELRPTPAAEDALIASAPRSDIMLALLYHLTYLDAGPPHLSRLFSEYLDAIYRVASKSRKRYSTVVRLAVLAQGGDLGDEVSEYVKRLYESDPVGVSRTIMDMPAHEAHLVCGEDAIPCPRKDGRATTPRPRR